MKFSIRFIQSEQGSRISLARKGGGCPPAESDCDFLQITTAATLRDEGTHRATFQILSSHHIHQIAQEGGRGGEGVGTLRVGLERHLHVVTVDLQSSDGAGLFGGEVAGDHGCVRHNLESAIDQGLREVFPSHAHKIQRIGGGVKR
jgi:hypothetical protein